MKQPKSKSPAPIRAHRATSSELAACRALIPEAFPPLGIPPPLFVVKTPEGAVIGAAALAWVPGGFGITVRVAEDWRRRGVGSALLRTATNLARGETPGLRSWRPMRETEEEAQFLRAAGFTPLRRLLVFETLAERFAGDMSALLTRLRRRDRIPANAQILSLLQAPAAEVGTLVASEFDVLSRDIAWRMHPGVPHAYDSALSSVLSVEGRVGGVWLCRRTGNLAEVDMLVIIPEFRHGWAQALLQEAVARQSREAGIERFRFCCDPSVHDTINLARRSGARAMPDEVVFGRQL